MFPALPCDHSSNGGAVARRGVPGVQTPAVLGDEPALLDAGGRSADTPVGEEDELVDPHRATRQEEARQRQKRPAPSQYTARVGDGRVAPRAVSSERASSARYSSTIGAWTRVSMRWMPPRKTPSPA